MKISHCVFLELATIMPPITTKPLIGLQEDYFNSTLMNNSAEQTPSTTKSSISDAKADFKWLQELQHFSPGKNPLDLRTQKDLKQKGWTLDKCQQRDQENYLSDGVG